MDTTTTRKTETTLKEFARLYADGYTLEEIATKLKRSYRTVQRFLKLYRMRNQTETARLTNLIQTLEDKAKAPNIKALELVALTKEIDRLSEKLKNSI